MKLMHRAVLTHSPPHQKPEAYSLLNHMLSQIFSRILGKNFSRSPISLPKAVRKPWFQMRPNGCHGNQAIPLVAKRFYYCSCPNLGQVKHKHAFIGFERSDESSMFCFFKKGFKIVTLTWLARSRCQYDLMLWRVKVEWRETWVGSCDKELGTGWASAE